jgi:hypothetical protein
MHIIAGAILILVGAVAVAYVQRGAAAFEREPPFLAVGVLLVAIGVGLCVRSRAAGLVAQIGTGAALLVVAGIVVPGWFTSGAPSTDEGLVRYFYLLCLAIVAAAMAVLFMLIRRAPRRASFGPIDVVPVVGLAAALALGVIWLVEDDVRLRPCRLGNEQSCATIATRLLEAAERAPATPPTPWEERAARALDSELCPGSESGPCGVRRYAVGSVALRAGRLQAAKEAFRQACDFDRSWCARAAQEKGVPWTPAEHERLERRAEP